MSAEFRFSTIYACSSCGGLLREVSGSGHNAGARVWSDGKEEGELLPDSHWMVMCPHCRAPLWLDELEGFEELGDDEGDDGLEWPDLDDVDDSDDADKADALDFVVPGFADYIEAVSRVVKFPEKVFELRLRAWWAGNDCRRGKGATAGLAADEVANLEALLGLLDVSVPYESLLKAEALRELGRFDEAAALLAASNDEAMARAVAIVAEGVARRETGVMLLVG